MEQVTAGYTAGPWRLKDGLIRCADAMPVWGTHRSESERNANALLMAAGPELLESLRELLSIVGDRLPMGAFPEAKAKALAIIELAEGR